MTTHYIAKHLVQSVHFIPAFDALIRRIEAELAKEGYKREERSPEHQLDENDASLDDPESNSDDLSDSQDTDGMRREDPPPNDS